MKARQYFYLLIPFFLFNFLVFMWTPGISLLGMNLAVLFSYLMLPILGFSMLFLLFYRVMNEHHKATFLMLLAAGGLLTSFGMGSHYVANELNPNVTYHGSDPYMSRLYFLDEYLTHTLIGAGVAIIAAVALVNLKRFNLRMPPDIRIYLSISSACTSGLTAFMFAVEAQQLPYFLAFTLLFLPSLVFVVLRERISLKENPVALMMVATLVISWILILFWGLSYGGFPQPTEVF